MYDIIRQIACAVRTGDMAAADHALDGLYGGFAGAVSFGRADADKIMRRDPPLPEPAEPHGAEFARIDAVRAAERAECLARDAEIEAQQARACEPTAKRRRARAA